MLVLLLLVLFGLIFLVVILNGSLWLKYCDKINVPEPGFFILQFTTLIIIITTINASMN